MVRLIHLILLFFSFNICFASFPLKNTNIQDQDIYISDQIVENSDPALAIVVLALSGLIGWLFYRSSKTENRADKERLDKTATMLTSGLLIFLIVLAVGAIVAVVLFFQWLNRWTVGT